MGFFARDRMVAPFAEAAFALAPGQVSEVVETRFGYHLIQVTDKQPAKEMGFEEVQPDLKAYLQREKTRVELFLIWKLTGNLDMIERIREVTNKPVGLKAVVGAYGWLENLCKEIEARGIETAPDFITVDGSEGGTGAAPIEFSDRLGTPLKEGLLLMTNRALSRLLMTTLTLTLLLSTGPSRHETFSQGETAMIPARELHGIHPETARRIDLSRLERFELFAGSRENGFLHLELFTRDEVELVQPVLQHDAKAVLEVLTNSAQVVRNRLRKLACQLFY